MYIDRVYVQQNNCEKFVPTRPKLPRRNAEKQMVDIAADVNLALRQTKSELEESVQGQSGTVWLY